MEKLTEKLDNLNELISKRIENLLKIKGVESKFSSRKVIFVEDENVMYNLGYSNWVVEVSNDCLTDNEGKDYNLSLFTTEQICKLLDSLI